MEILEPAHMEEALADMLRLLLYPNSADREGLKETPRRVRAYLETMTSGYKQDPEALLKTFEDGAQNYDEMVFVGSIPLYSLCEHHLVPFFGVAHVAYIPEKRIVGLSKIPRVVEAFSRQLQVQERLTVQIADAIDRALKPKGVGVVIRARHMCVEMRGIEKPGTITFTSALRGVMKDGGAREEFLRFVDMADRRGGVL